MIERFKSTLTKFLTGRGAIVWGGIALLLFVSSTEFVTLLQDGIIVSSETSIRGALAGLILSISLFIGRNRVSLALAAHLAVSFFFFWDGKMLLWMVISVAVFCALAATSPSRIVRTWYLGLLAAWMLQYFFRAGVDAILIVLLLPLAALTYVLTRAIFVFRERSVRAEKEMVINEELIRQAIDDERKNIARDLHDIVAHDITVVAMQSKAAKFANDGQQALDAIDVIAKLSTETLHDLRLMLNVLRTDGTMSGTNTQDAAKPSATTVYAQQGVEMFAQRLREAKFLVTSHTDEEVSELPRSAQTALYRVMQEATTNVIKHGRLGGNCSISLTVRGREAKLKITNQMPVNGSRERSGVLGGSGLIGMDDRMQAFGGKFQAGREGDHWVLRANIPF